MMNKVVLLSEIRKEKTNVNNRFLEDKKVNSEREQIKNIKAYANFEKKFDSLKNNNYFFDLKNSQNKYEKKLNSIIKRIFSFNNKLPLIGFINSIYNDELSKDTKIKYIKNNQEGSLKSSNYNVRILAEDDYRKFEYEIKLETVDDQNIAIVISKINLESNFTNIINLNKIKKEYKDEDSANLSKGSKDSHNRVLIMFNSNIEVPDVFEFKEEADGKNIEYRINVMKSWKYDFKQLSEKNMYLLFPMKVLDLKNRLLTISKDVLSKELIKDEIVRFFKDMNRYFMKIKDKNLISEEDITEYNLIAIELLTYFIKEKSNSFVDIKKDIEATLKHLVV
ncbi:hypothetical protein [Clostridium sp. C2-6-12]|uniref:hypothetical protein n=1 Tax=Clostridium sp. C2-6-12 TaxID=2698832 RepID=UPI001FAB3959|nr:hypothetical protein [Clostridium sp. C2-6-12]